MNNSTNLRYELLAKGIFAESIMPITDLNSLVNLIKPYKTDVELIRLGSDSDGGYLIPNDLKNIIACFSPGVDNIASFEQALFANNIGSHLADYSVDFVPNNIPVLSFEKKFIDSLTYEYNISLEDWVNQYEPNSVENSLILQMDIEGAEYKALLACPEYILNKFKIIVIEFHQIESWAIKDFFYIVESVFKKLLKNHTVVHCHPNNAMGIVNMNGFKFPRVFEMTLYKSNLIKNKERALLPHPLDKANVDYFDELEFPDNWIY